MNPASYESEQVLSEYLLFHYGKAEEILPYDFGPAEALDYPARVVRECIQVSRLSSKARALDLGCAVGRSSFELARFCASVVGIDASERFIHAANALKKEGCVVFDFTEEGELKTKTLAQVPAGIDPSRVSFEVGDACNVKKELGTFDVVLMSNLIDRLPDPASCLSRIHERIHPQGQLIVSSPYTWLSRFTPKDCWLGGVERNGKKVRSEEALFEILGPHFDFAGKKDLPFLIREHSRKFQWGVSQATVWIRKES